MKDQTPPICNYEGSDYQHSFWDEGDRAYEDAAEAIALKRLLPDGGDLLLELGAGAGRNTPRYKNFNQVVLLDYSRTQLEQAQARLGNGNYVFVAADVYRLPFVSGLFDAATMIRTLHHMADPELALSQIVRVLITQGIFILEFANKRNLKAILRFLLGRQAWNPFTEKPVEFAELNFDFHPKAVRRYLCGVGFRIERQLTVSHFRLGVLKKIFPTKLLVGFDSLLQWTGSFLQVSPSVFTRARKIKPTLKAAVEGFFQCPVCGTALGAEKQNLHCEGCDRVWEYREGIYDFRVKEDV